MNFKEATIMSTKASFAIILVLTPFLAKAQDSTHVLNEVLIEAYKYERPIIEVPAAVATLSTADLERFNRTSVLPAVNTIAGVRMEERSPGSYRFSIRGSLLRSPFGVRNVKMYWNGLPLTDAGGNTYLNLIDPTFLTNLEVIKGPGGSLYGAGTGGVVLFKNTAPTESETEITALAGSYGLRRLAGNTSFNTEKLNISLSLAHQQSDGYREQTEMTRDGINLNLNYNLTPRSILSASVFYSELSYGTPGGLTKAQFEENPKRARPATATLPGAVQQNASVNNKTIFGGITYDNQWTEKFSTRLSVYGSNTDFENPAIFNFEQREETNLGARMENQWIINDESIFQTKVTFGAEYQYFVSPVQVNSNDGGKVGSQLLLDDDLKANQLLAFVQAEQNLSHNFFLTVGLSNNYLRYNFVRNSPEQIEQTRKFDPVFSPRVALLKKISQSLSFYASVSKGFSPPSLAEVRPSTGAFNNNLNAEKGINFESGMHSKVFSNKLTFDITAYQFQLDETIVIQREENGAEYFVNAGSTRQRGIEAMASWTVPVKGNAITLLKLSGSYTYNHYRFSKYVQDAQDYSGNDLTGVAPNLFNIMLDATHKSGAYINITSNYTDHIPLNDANTEYASSFVLLGSRIGFKKLFADKLHFDFFGGVDNAFDKRYSPGNDLNAAGRRYYNAAMPRNFYVGIKVKEIHRRKL